MKLAALMLKFGNGKEIKFTIVVLEFDSKNNEIGFALKIIISNGVGGFSFNIVDIDSFSTKT